MNGQGSYCSSLVDQPADPVDLEVRYRRDVPVDGHDADDAGTFEDRQPLSRLEAGEAVSGKERPVDAFAAVLPAAPSRDRRQKGLDPLLFDLTANHLLVARSRPHGVPRGCTHRSALAGVLAGGRRRLSQLLFVSLLQLCVLPFDDGLAANARQEFANLLLPPFSVNALGHEIAHAVELLARRRPSTFRASGYGSHAARASVG